MHIPRTYAKPGREEACRFLEQTINGHDDSGDVFFEQDVFGLQIREAFGNINGINMTWKSYPAAFSDQEVSWAFRTTILWPPHLGLNPEFNGMERYQVVKRDDKGRPTLLVGPLNGCIQERHEFALAGQLYVLEERLLQRTFRGQGCDRL
ncbi:MAG: hypothetical protein WB992_25940 [Bryobacteraceae bacterium]